MLIAALALLAAWLFTVAIVVGLCLSAAQGDRSLRRRTRRRAGARARSRLRLAA